MGEWLFPPEGQADSSQARRAFAPKGLKHSAQGFNPGKPANKRFALTRHMNVRSMKNTRSTGLEMLKGRETIR
jgi:hypothetical protein